jgi:hypothetical protein
MFTLSQEMLDIVNYRKESTCCLMSGSGCAVKTLVSGVLDAAVQEGSLSTCAVLNPPMKCCWNS